MFADFIRLVYIFPKKAKHNTDWYDLNPSTVNPDFQLSAAWFKDNSTLNIYVCGGFITFFAYVPFRLTTNICQLE